LFVIPSGPAVVLVVVLAVVFAVVLAVVVVVASRYPKASALGLSVGSQQEGL
jgi:hypothetical protein